ncbi:hypothetical protein GC170_15895 [bacterium]|nr:hypothetical protein [bacterium]
MIRHRSTRITPKRRGIILLLVALLMPCFFGFLSLSVDLGRALERHRMVQSTADAIAVSLVNRFDHGYRPSQLLANANSVRSFHLPESTALGWNLGTIDSVNNPPTSGAYAGNSNYYEVIVSTPVQGLFAPVLGLAGSTRVTARAVAGLEDSPVVESIVALDPCGNPGIGMSGNSVLRIQGGILTNSGRAGIDQYGQTVNLGLSGNAVSFDGTAALQVMALSVRGGVSGLGNISNYVEGAPSPLRANIRRVLADPLASLPIPSPSNTPSITNWSSKKSSRDDTEIGPGIYSDISNQPNNTLRLKPGVYIISPQKKGDGLNIQGSIIGDNVMFYITSNNFIGHNYDALDGPVNPTVAIPVSESDCSLPPNLTGESNPIYGVVNITSNDQTVQLTGIKDPASPYNNMLFFQRRRNQETVNINPRGLTPSLFHGIIYAKWAPLFIGSNGVVSFNNPVAVGSFMLGGGGQMLITTNDVGWSLLKTANLVE